MTCFPKSSLTWNFTLDFKQLVFCASPFFLQTGPLIFEWNVKLTYHGATEGVIFLIGSWCTDSSPSHLLVKLPTFFEWPSLDKPLGSAVIPVAPFPTTLSPSTPVFMNMLGYSTMWTAGCFSDDLLRRRVSMTSGQLSGHRLSHDCEACWTIQRQFEGSGNLWKFFNLIIRMRLLSLEYRTFSQYSDFLRNWSTYI